MKRTSCVIGSGPNGLAAAIVLAQAGVQVTVYEAEAIPGGAVRSMELTLPGFKHDFGSAVYPLGIGSPFFSSLPLADFGLQWIHSPAPFAHPLDDGTAVVLERELAAAQHSLGEDGKSWVNLMQPFVEHWREFSSDVLRPMPSIPAHPFLVARFGVNGIISARGVVKHFRNQRTRALFAGVAAHSLLSMNEPMSGAFGMLMAIPAHAVGWPIPRGGAQSLTNALLGYLQKLGGEIQTSSRVAKLADLPRYDLYLCDVTPRQLIAIAGERMSESFIRVLRRFRYGPGAF